ncbi:MAG: hypothetical protein ABJL99_10030 [Aliishimia sp.]
MTENHSTPENTTDCKLPVWHGTRCPSLMHKRTLKKAKLFVANSSTDDWPEDGRLMW